MFADARVREALIGLFDFEWINRTLYAGLYRRTQSYFERSILASAGRPADARERELLAPFPNAVKPAIMDGTFRFPSTDGSGRNRDNQEKSFRCCRRPATSCATASSSTPRPASRSTSRSSPPPPRRRGCCCPSRATSSGSASRCKLRVVDSAQYQARLTRLRLRHDPEHVVVLAVARQRAAVPLVDAGGARPHGTYNFAGVENPAADAMIQALLAAKTEDDFVSAVRALDRVLLSGDYVIPLFFIPKQWVAYWTRLQHPEKTPLFGYNVDSWWSADAK